MVKYSVKKGGEMGIVESRMLHALADSTRYDIMARLVSKRELTATAIADDYSISLPAVSKHLKVLKDAKLVFAKKDGLYQLYSPNHDALRRMKVWLHSDLFCNSR